MPNSTWATSKLLLRISTDPSPSTLTTPAYLNRGIAKSELSDHTAAIADYDRAISINPNYALAYNNRGNAKRDLGDPAAAIADYDRAISIVPTTP